MSAGKYSAGQSVYWTKCPHDEVSQTTNQWTKCACTFVWHCMPNSSTSFQWIEVIFAFNRSEPYIYVNTLFLGNNLSNWYLYLRAEKKSTWNRLTRWLSEKKNPDWSSVLRKKLTSYMHMVKTQKQVFDRGRFLGTLKSSLYTHTA